jgi:undecaprenyl-diphosphatase
MSDTSVFLFINGLAGRVPFIDAIFKGVGDDYFLPVIVCLILVTVWLGTRDFTRRKINQTAILAAISGMGIGTGFVALCNLRWFRIRPFYVLPDQVHLLFYKPTDSSFPSNFAAVLFGIAFPVIFYNKKLGIVLLVIAVLGGFSRIFIGIHYPLDVLAGAGIGIFSGLVAYGAIRLLRPLVDYILLLLRKVYLA